MTLFLILQSEQNTLLLLTPLPKCITVITVHANREKFILYCVDRAIISGVCEAGIFPVGGMSLQHLIEGISRGIP